MFAAVPEFGPSNLPGPLLLALACNASVILLYVVGLFVYNVFFHPLRAYPGPKLWAGFRFPYVYHQVKGRLPYRAKQLHDRYGSVARIAPNELSYVTAAAWKDVYGTRQGHPQNPKDLAAFPALHPGQSVDLVRANDADHARHRRLLSHAFSAKALDDQQPIVLSYVDLLIQRLRENAARPQDMVAWYNWTSADIIGDLAFGESFHGLRDQQWHPWVKTMTQGLETGLILAAARRYKLDFLLKSVIPKATMESFEQAFAYSKEKVEARIQRGADRPDFMSYIMRNDQKGREMSRGEIDANAEVLAVAGSETTASFLSGATYYLCMNPRIREKVTKEIRDVFDADQDINLSLLSKIEYLSAVLKESLRLYPPAPGSMPRVTANSEMICGRWTPAGTSASVFQWPAYHSSTNFHEPDSFVPERWLSEVPAEFSKDNREIVQPFSVGPRNCLGKHLAYMQMRLVLAKLLWNFDLAFQDEDQGRAWINQKITLVWVKTPLMVKLTPNNAKKTS